jgi:hypothetical protein
LIVPRREGREGGEGGTVGREGRLVGGEAQSGGGRYSWWRWVE